MSGIFVSIILLAMVTMLVTRPGVANLIRQISGYMSDAIKAVLGVAE